MSKCVLLLTTAPVRTDSRLIVGIVANLQGPMNYNLRCSHEMQGRGKSRDSARHGKHYFI